MNDLKTYLRTSQLTASRRKNYDSNLGVSITVDTLKKYSARFPMDGVQTKEIDGKDGKELFCLCTERGTVDLALLKRTPQHFAHLHKFLWRCLEQVDISEHNLSSEHGFDWFRFFLSQRHRTDAIQSFLTVDSFSGRVHTPVSSLYREYRKLLTLCGEQTTSLDIAQMQPSLLAAHLFINVGKNSFSDAIDKGEDVYTLLQTKAGLATRDEAKKKFFEIAFGMPSDKLAELFDGEAWIKWINDYKTVHDTRNPHGVEKPHSNLAWLLQSTEVLIMREIWETLARINIPFLTVHDEIISRSKDAERVEAVMSNILSENLKTFKINLKGEHSARAREIEPPSVKSVKSEDETKHIFCVPQQSKGEIYRLPAQTTWTNEIQELETYFAAVDLPAEPVKLNSYTLITNVPQFVESHLLRVKQYNGRNTFLPYLNRLQTLKQILAK